MSTVALRAAGLTKRYGSVRAHDGLDLEVGAGEVHAFLGPNGAGKTTTIRILLGLLRKDGGEVSLLGADPWRDAVELHRRLARLPATMVVAAPAVLLFGLLPWECIALAWTAVALVGVIGVFGLPLQWPAWMMDISPFTQVPKLPGGTVSAASLLWLGAVALTISAAGLIGLRHRDIGDVGPSRPVSAVRDRILAYASFDPSRQAAKHD